jgi:beta-N-acetylhexosaminidase
MPDQPDALGCDTRAPATSLSRRLLLGGAAGTIASGCITSAPVLAKRSDDENFSKIIDRMTIAEKAAQLFVVQASGTTMSDSFERLLCDLQPGGVIFFSANIGAADELRAFTRAIHRSNDAIPPLIAIDQEGGPVSRIPGDPAPGAVELGRKADKKVRQMARDRAEFLADFGLDVYFAPVADVAYKPTSFMASRSFGADPELVPAKVLECVRGSRSGGMAGAAKHFPGHGRTPLDSHLTQPEALLSLRGWRKTDALPFKAAVEPGVEMVMIGHLHYPKWDDQPTSLSRLAVTTLREGLGFDGAVVTDDLGMGALRGIDPFRVVDRVIHAGVDLLLYATFPVRLEDLVTHVRRRIHRGEVSEKRIDASLRRILTMKAHRFELALPAGKSKASEKLDKGEVKER